MGKLAEAYVDITPNMAGLDRGLDTAHGKLRAFVGAGNTALAGLGVGLSTAAITAGLLDAAKAAADLGETVSKAKVVFGGGFGAIVATSEELAEKFGVVRRESLDAAANLGLVTQAAGMSKSASADLSSQLLRLAADASSFYNVPIAEALEKIRSALVGESEPIRSFGVLLSEDAVKTEALRMGLTKTTGALTDQQKVMARASLVIKGLSAATGDLERTQDSASNQLRKLTGDWENFRADFGKGLTGPLTDAIKLLREFGDIAGKMAGAKPGENLGSMIGAGINAARSFTTSPWESIKDSIAAMMGGAGGAVAKAKIQARADALAGLNKAGPAQPAPTPAQAAAAKHAAAMAARAQEQMKSAQEFARKAKEAPARAAIERVFDAKRRFDVSDAGIALGRQQGAILQAVMSRGLLRGGAGLLAGLAPEEKKKKKRPVGDAGVMSLDDAKRMSQVSALTRHSPELEETKKTNQKLDDAKAILSSILGAVGKPQGAVARGRVDP